MLDYEKLVANPTAKIADSALTARGYPQKHVAAEIIARLITPDKWRELDLKSRAQAGELAVLCSRLLREHNGDAANEVIRAIVKEYPEAKASLTYGNSGRTGRGSDSIDAISALRRGGTEPDLANTRRLPRLSDDHAERQNSLFGSDSDEQVAETAARDRDQLEGEQLNAPLTREEQLKKLKRSKDQPQQSLFEAAEEAPQGSLFSVPRAAPKTRAAFSPTGHYTPAEWEKILPALKNAGVLYFNEFPDNDSPAVDNFGKWSKKMTAHFGAAIQPSLRRLWPEVQPLGDADRQEMQSLAIPPHGKVYDKANAGMKLWSAPFLREGFLHIPYLEEHPHTASVLRQMEERWEGLGGSQNYRVAGGKVEPSAKTNCRWT